MRARHRSPPILIVLSGGSWIVATPVVNFDEPVPVMGADDGAGGPLGIGRILLVLVGVALAVILIAVVGRGALRMPHRC